MVIKPGAPFRSIALVGLVVLLAAWAPTFWAWQRIALSEGQFWRMWSGHFAHWGWVHALSNMAVCAVLFVMLGKRARDWLLAGIGVAPLMSAVLYWGVPSLMDYRGLSGLNSFWLVGLLEVFQQEQPSRRMVAWGIVLLDAAKVVWDAQTGKPSAFLPVGIQVVWQVHATGLCLGGIFWALRARMRRHAA